MRRIRAALTSLALAVLVACSSATSLKPPAEPGPPKMAVFFFRGNSVERRANPAEITFIASISGGENLSWCPQEIVWDFGPGAKPSRETRSVECYDRDFQNSATFYMGHHRVRATILSNGHVAGFIEKEVVIGPSEDR